ncbi:UDP-N-acetylglucosamine pyrophosphorylase [Maudiozyma exigua]|uniref:UDP-N-acetylglucosamine diphosphorylase n=1 Tax=Maudiozyma exigua TaxID=34358 RepID=A0A9P6WCW2_MAUEX|nr:UDP-N-acetylglucosamine pyrophosphorylase [Kazachstania exigua]
MTNTNIDELYRTEGQEHLFQHVSKLTSDEKDKFYQNLTNLAQRITPNALQQAYKRSLQQLADDDSKSSHIKTLPSTSYQSIIGNPLLAEEYYGIGLKSIQQGEVAVILMAGGQGTRLGSSSPKGCYDINLPSHKSLFQIQAEKIWRLQRLSNCKKVIPWYIMTSEPTRVATESFFIQNSYFGLQKDQIFFFNQGTLPALDSTGKKIFLSNPTNIVQSPDGNGGLYHAIKDNKLMDDFKKRGIKHIYMYCVDNVLSKVADPVFIGFSIKYNFLLATKAVRKRDAHESVGLIASKDGKPCVIEYSEISNELAEERDSEGLLKLRAGNIVNHYYSIDLLEKQLNHWCENSVYHIAKKKIPYYDNVTDEYIKPEDVNGVKLEQFIFDVFPEIPLDRFGCLEVERSEEFSPLKNAPGTDNDNPETARESYLKLGTSWLVDAGASLAKDVYVEVSNKISYQGENLEKYKDETFNKDKTLLEL